MEFELLKKSHVKRNIIIGVTIVLIISAVVLQFTRAKYRVTESIPLVTGTINYTLPDLNIIGLYVDDEEVIELDSNKEYTLDTSKSTCTYKDGSAISNLNINYDGDTKALSISPYTTKGTKCTLYFDEVVSISDTLLANYPTQFTRTDFSTTVTNTTTGTIYYADTSKGRTYYFAGNPTDNWVSFGGFYWRIIRINEDGTIRLIYQGTSANTTGEGTQIGTSMFAYDNTTIYHDNAYVGYMYEKGKVHGLAINSTIKTELDNWYFIYLSRYSQFIDHNVGFCGDRTPSTSNTTINNSGGTGPSTVTYYGANIRLSVNKMPSFECPNSSDLYTTGESGQGNQALTYPIGLITADEAWFAGGVSDNSSNFYLSTNQDYWTMSPFNFRASWSYYYAFVFRVTANGLLDGVTTDSSRGIRPVINLKADVQISQGSGTSTDPYVIVT